MSFFLRGRVPRRRQPAQPTPRLQLGRTALLREYSTLDTTSALTLLNSRGRQTFLMSSHLSSDSARTRVPGGFRVNAHWSPATLSQPGQSPALSSPHAWGPLSPQDAGARLSINHATDRSHLQALSGSWGQIPRGSQCQTKANLEGGTTCQWMPPALKFWLTMVAPPTKPEGHPMQQYLGVPILPAQDRVRLATTGARLCTPTLSLA